MKLKPCPFCGGEADTLCAVGFFAVPINKVYCMECGALVEGYSNEVDAIEAWNRRTPLEDIVEQLEELQERHPYKVAGDFDTYSEYNQAWESCSDQAIEIVKGGAV